MWWSRVAAPRAIAGLHRSLYSVLAAGLFAVPLWSVPTAGRPAAIATATLLVITIRNPDDGLLIVAGLLPLAAPIGRLFRLPFDSHVAGELLLLPFLAAACARSAWRTDSRSARLTAGVAASAAIVGAAVLVGLAHESGGLASSSVRCWHHATTRYFAGPVQCAALHDGMIWLEGLFLAWCVSWIAGAGAATAARAGRMLMTGAVAASLFAAATVLEVFLQQPSARDALAVLGATRIGIHVPDVNAVGSMYALFTVPAFWLAHSRKRGWAWLAFLPLAVALWWAGSRAAVAAACVGTWFVAARSGTYRSRTLVIGAALAAAAVAVSLARLSGAWVSLADAAHIRIEMARIGLAITAGHPAFGVGPGQFPAASRPLITDDILAMFPHAVDGENSHNNFVQFLAEFGVVGTLALMSVIVYPVVRAASTIGRPSMPRDAAGWVGGLVAFLLTCLTGHPFLLPLCVWLYFLTIGIVSGMAPDDESRSSRWSEWAAIACVAVAALSIRGRIADANRTAASAPAPAARLAAERGTLDGVSYTTMTRQFSIFVDARARTVTVPLRRTPDSASPCPVMVSFNFRRADVVEPPADSWLRARYVLRASTPPVAGRLDLLLRAANCRISVGELIIE
jgi:hypothetical protein